MSLRHINDGPVIGNFSLSISTEWWKNARSSKYEGIGPNDILTYSKSAKKISKWYSTCRLRHTIQACSVKFNLKTAIEWRPPYGVQYKKMMDEYDGNL